MADQDSCTVERSATITRRRDRVGLRVAGEPQGRPGADGDHHGTHVTWSLTGPRTRMLTVMGVFTSRDKLRGPDYEKGLGRLTTVVETPAT